MVGKIGRSPRSPLIETSKKSDQTVAPQRWRGGKKAKEARQIAAQLKEELRIARSDNETLKEAIVSRFVSDWGGKA